MKLLVVNCGSSSLKCRLYDMSDERALASGQIERLGQADARLTSAAGALSEDRTVAVADHAEALEVLASALASLALEAGENLPPSPDAVGHRVVHGGERFRDATVVDDAVEAAIEALAPLAPMHNPPCLRGIRKARARFPQARHVAVFDTAFHHTLPPRAYLYALPYALYQRDGVRRYGFHGTSHRFAASRARALLELGEASRVITCHLGAGCSLAAVENGRCIDTSMGMTPLEGLMMATRSGDVDPGIFAFLIEKRGMTPSEINALLNRESGLLGVSGLSGDIRELESAAAGGHERAELALDMFAYRVRKALGAYLAALGGADAVAFTGGAGANSAALRARVLAGLDGLGLVLDGGANAACAGREAVVSAPGSPTALVVVPANEELLIARETLGALRRVDSANEANSGN